MNVTSNVDLNWFNEIQYGNKGAALFIIAYIGFYGISIICLFAQQLKDTQRQQYELPAYFLKTLWDVPHKNKLYQELADVERLKQIFRAYFSEHETYLTTDNDDLQAIAEERAHACALRYRQKIRRLHLAHTDYYLDTVQRLSSDERNDSISKYSPLIRESLKTTIIDDTATEENEKDMITISVV